jgi:hypothetical protein
MRQRHPPITTTDENKRMDKIENTIRTLRSILDHKLDEPGDEP